eukprot:TRINITY_DN15880_c0_g1_i2.p1 TRINITY_DN15880_c0_g1~~TRINITY_DN15880_c0_g1_i2.p1  ORF type:complete len:453 (-),score=58.43 TRINITY_DN15880_c0_g1_i2:355-1530(-)
MTISLVLGVAGILALCMANRANLISNHSTSIRQLLESPEMIQVATENTMALHAILRGDEPRVRQLVAKGLRKISERMRHGSDELALRMDGVTLTPRQKEDVLHVVAGMRNPHVQAFGQSVAEVLSYGQTEGREGVRRRLEKLFETRVEDVKALHAEVIPASLGRTSPDGKQTLRTERMRVMRDFPSQWYKSADKYFGTPERKLYSGGFGAPAPTPPPTSDVSDTKPGSILQGKDMDKLAKKWEEGLGILAGLTEQVRVALDQIDVVGEDFGKDMKIPYWSKSLVGGLDFILECADCVQRADSNEVKLVMCPMKYASAAADFLEALDNVMGMDGANFYGAKTAPTNTGSPQATQTASTAAQTTWNQPTPTPQWPTSFAQNAPAPTQGGNIWR